MVALSVVPMLICTGLGVMLVLVTGAVLSILIPLTDAGALTFPATSVQVPLAEKPVPSVLRITGAVQLAMPESASEPANVTVTLVLFQPAAFGAGEILGTIEGGLVSILTVTDVEAVAPWPFVALHVNVVPLVSAPSIEVLQPVLEVIPVPVESVTLQLTVTGIVVFQPKPLGAGLTLATIVGGVGLVLVFVTVSWVVNPR